MYRPTIKSDLWLGVMAAVFLALGFWVERSTVTVRKPNHEAKIAAANTMLEALKTLTDYRFPGMVSSKSATDPLIYTMLGEKDSPITTDEGNIEDKITVLNPNFAAVIVDLFTQAGVSQGDTIAVLLTGSMPGANIAVLSAAKAMSLYPIIITSVGSSTWGANSPDFTWVDMEKILADHQVLPFRSTAASLGGSNDQGGLRLPEVGRQMIADAVDRNGITLIHQGSLGENIQARIKIFQSYLPLNLFKAVVNVGGGIAAMGHAENGNLIHTGTNLDLPFKNYPAKGVIHQFAEAGVPVVHIYAPSELAKEYGLSIAELPLPRIGAGKVYEAVVRYNVMVASVALFLMLLVLAVVKYFDLQAHKWYEQKIDPDNII